MRKKQRIKHRGCATKLAEAQVENQRLQGLLFDSLNERNRLLTKIDDQLNSIFALQIKLNDANSIIDKYKVAIESLVKPVEIVAPPWAGKYCQEVLTLIQKRVMKILNG